MSEKDYDPFAGSTGLPDDFDAVVKAAWFEFDPEFNNGQSLVLKFTLETDEPDFGKDGNGVGDLLLSTGKGWTTNDRGATAVREDGSRKGFNTSTAYFLWIDGAVKCDGAEKVLRSAERGDPRKADMWVGTAWHINRKTVSYGGDIGDKDKLVPTSFLGLATNLAEIQRGSGATAGAASGPAAAPTKAAAAKKVPGPVKKAAAPVATAPTTSGIDAELRTQLKEIAFAAESHEQFVEQAFELAAVSEDEAVQQEVMKGDEGSIWAEAVAEYNAANPS